MNERRKGDRRVPPAVAEFAVSQLAGVGEKTATDSASRAEELIACLEAEIAKRDERIAGLEHRCGMYGLELTNEVERRLSAERRFAALQEKSQ